MAILSEQLSIVHSLHKLSRKKSHEVAYRIMDLWLIHVLDFSLSKTLVVLQLFGLEMKIVEKTTSQWTTKKDKEDDWISHPVTYSLKYPSLLSRTCRSGPALLVLTPSSTETIPSCGRGAYGNIATVQRVCSIYIAWMRGQARAWNRWITKRRKSSVDDVPLRKQSGRLFGPNRCTQCSCAVEEDVLDMGCFCVLFVRAHEVHKIGFLLFFWSFWGSLNCATRKILRFAFQVLLRFDAFFLFSLAPVSFLFHFVSRSLKKWWCLRTTSFKHDGNKQQRRVSAFRKMGEMRLVNFFRYLSSTFADDIPKRRGSAAWLSS